MPVWVQIILQVLPTAVSLVTLLVLYLRLSKVNESINGLSHRVSHLEGLDEGEFREQVRQGLRIRSYPGAMRRRGS